MNLLAVFIICLIGCVASETKKQWTCVEYGPTKPEKPDGTQEPIYRHLVDDEKIKSLNEKMKKSNDKYEIADLAELIDRGVDIYEELPMKCTNNTNANQTLEFIQHPHVYKVNYKENDHQTKTATVMFRMGCEVFRLKGYTHTKNFTWNWTRTNKDKMWVPIEENDNSYKITYGYVDGINYYTNLTITSLTTAHEAEYICSAENEFGSNEHKFKLEVFSLHLLVIPFVAVLILVTIVSLGVFFRERYVKKKEEMDMFTKVNTYPSQAVNA